MAVLPVVAAPSPYLATPVGAATRDFVFTAMSGGADTFPCTGRELLIIRNPSAGALTITIAGIADDKARKGDITAYSVGVGLQAIFSFVGGREAWADAAGNVTVTASGAALTAAVIRLP